MRRFTAPGNVDLPEHESFTLNDIKYPSNWLTLASPDDLAAVGIVFDEIDPPIEWSKSVKVAAAWSACQAAIENGSVSVETSAGTHSYGTDATSQENIKSVLLGVALGVTPNPRPWTPQGALAPVSLTHADLTLVGGTMMAAVDAQVQAYLAHKSAILQLATVAEVAAYVLD